MCNAIAHVHNIIHDMDSKLVLMLYQDLAKC